MWAAGRGPGPFTEPGGGWPAFVRLGEGGLDGPLEWHCPEQVDCRQPVRPMPPNCATTHAVLHEPGRCQVAPLPTSDVLPPAEVAIAYPIVCARAGSQAPFRALPPPCHY